MFNALLFVLCYVGLFIFVFFETAAAFFLYQLVYFFNPNNRWWDTYIPGISYSFFAVALMGLIYIFNYKQCQQNKLFAVPAARWVCLLFLMFYIASFYAIWPEAHAFALEGFFKLVITMTLAYKLIDTTKRLDTAIFCNIMGAAYIGITAYQVGRNSGDRVQGIGMVDAPDANGFAAAIAPTLVYLLYFLWTNRPKWMKAAVVFGGVFIANALILINSRGSFLGVFCGCGYYFYYLMFSKAARKEQFMPAVFFILASLSVAVYLTDDAFWDRIATITQSTEVDYEQESAATRTVFWVTSIEIANDYPFGLGFRGFNAKADEYLPEDLNTGGSRVRSVHSSWFEALSEVGYPGFVFFIMMFVSTFIATRKCKKKLLAEGDTEGYFRVVAVEGGLITFMIAMTFMNRMRAEILYWCLLYCAIVYNIYILKAKAVEPKSMEGAESTGEKNGFESGASKY